MLWFWWREKGIEKRFAVDIRCDDLRCNKVATLFFRPHLAGEEFIEQGAEKLGWLFVKYTHTCTGHYCPQHIPEGVEMERWFG